MRRGSWTVFKAVQTYNYIYKGQKWGFLEGIHFNIKNYYNYSISWQYLKCVLVKYLPGGCANTGGIDPGGTGTPSGW